MAASFSERAAITLSMSTARRKGLRQSRAIVRLTTFSRAKSAATCKCRSRRGRSNEVHTLFKVQGLRRVGPLAGRFDGDAPGLAAGFGLRRRLLLDAAAARAGRLARRFEAGAPSGSLGDGRAFR